MTTELLQKHWPQLRKHWQLSGAAVDAKAIGAGLINAGWRVPTTLPGSAGEVFLQRINTRVFPEPAQVTRNSIAIADHLRAKNADGIYHYQVMQPLPTTTQEFHYQQGEDYWRAFGFIAGAHSKEQIEMPTDAYACALAFADFVAALSDIDRRRIGPTIVDFHEPAARLQTLASLRIHAPSARLAQVKKELNAIAGHQDLVQRFQELKSTPALPLRIVHNDTKLSNVLFDQSDRVIAVVDWDTVMPGYLMFDFGDMVRSLCNTGEDQNNQHNEFNLATFTPLAAGYTHGIGACLTPLEHEHLVYGAQLVTLELAIRFLSDYLAGDRYFRIDYPEQNWRRAQNQLALLAAMRAAEPAMQAALRG